MDYHLMAIIIIHFFRLLLPLDPLQTDAVDVDIDEILDMDNDDIRRSHLAVSKRLLS